MAWYMTYHVYMCAFQNQYEKNKHILTQKANYNKKPNAKGSTKKLNLEQNQAEVTNLQNLKTSF